MGSERAHVRGAQRGSASDIEALFRLHWPRAHRAAYLVVHDAAAAEDIAQEAFLAAIRNLDRFDRAPPVRAVAAPDRRQPRDRLVARAAAARRDRARRRAGAPIPAAARRLAARRARRAAARPPRRDRPPPSARVHARRDRRAARPAARHGQLAPAPRARLAQGDGVRLELERIEIPDEHEARERSWAVVSAAFAEREPQPRRRSWKPVGRDRGRARRRRRVCSARRARGARRAPRGRRRRGERSGAVLAAGARDGCSSPPTRARGSSTRTARSGCSAPTARHRGRRSGASSSPRGRTSWRR